MVLALAVAVLNSDYTVPKEWNVSPKLIAEVRSAPQWNYNFRARDHVVAHCKIFGKYLYLDTDLDLDADGKRPASLKPGQYDQKDTAFFSQVDPNRDAYFVLPAATRVPYGIKKGDIAVVITYSPNIVGRKSTPPSKPRIAFAMYADVNNDKIGEGSIALHRALGHESVVPMKAPQGKYTHEVSAIGLSRAITIVFPGSGTKAYLSPEEVNRRGKALWDDLCAKHLK